MAKFFNSGKWKKRTAAGLLVALSATLSLGVLAACGDTSADDDDDNSSTTAPKTDVQLLKNGDFEFYEEMTKELADKRVFFNSPTNWSFSSGSPSSDTKSGLIDVDEFDYFAKEGAGGTAFSSIDEAVAHWEDEGVTLYDRLKFLQDKKDDIKNLETGSAAKTLFDKYSYSIDFEDVEKLNEELGGEIKLHDDGATLPEGEKTMREQGKTGVLMIHNQRTSEGVRGTGQSYSSSTTITLNAGTAAKVSVWVKTSNLYHYYEDDKVEVSQRGGAYIGVTNTVGGSTLDQMQIKNINTKVTNPDGDNNGWEKYTVYVRANTFATTTFRIVLGLGMGNSDNRYEQVDGYAFFDDITCDVISADEYNDAVDEKGLDKPNNSCNIDSLAEDKKFDATSEADVREFALDLYAGDNESFRLGLTSESFALTKETSGNKTYDSTNAGLADNRDPSDPRASFTGVTTLAGLRSTTNGYLKNIYKDDFEDKFPFSDQNASIVMLFSSNGAAYTATLEEDTVKAGESKLISFFVKTSEIISSRSGATITLVDGGNKTQIGAFDSTTVATVDINDDRTDIYDGWVQCFFFITNPNKEKDMPYHLELSYGPTTLVSATASSFGQGYAAFTNFETRPLSSAQANYATTGDRAKSVTLTGKVADSSAFDTASATSDIEKSIASPSSYVGIVGGSRSITEDSENVTIGIPPEGVVTGMLSSNFVKKYDESNAQDPEAWYTALTSLANGGATDWWKDVFGSKNDASVARQPLVIMNASGNDTASYGYIARQVSTLSSSTAYSISLRVKASVGTTAYIYLTDTSDVTKNGVRLSPAVPKMTYWYDDNGNICKGDPSSEDYNPKTDVLYTLGDNGLYTKTGANDGVYYANLYNYDEKNGNLVTKDGTAAFFGKDGKYYAYYDEESDTYSTPVENLPAEIARYDFTGKTMPEAMMKVEGTGDWVDVTFYVRTGDTGKTYRLEVWAGARENAENGIPAGGYVFFDSNPAAQNASNYDEVLTNTVNTLKEIKENLVDPDDNKSNLKDALYYTFTFFDSKAYLRYDESLDTEGIGNLYDEYKQSEKTEEIVALFYNDKTEQTPATEMTMFLNYQAFESTVTPREADTGDDDATDEEETSTDSDLNIWTVLSASLLGVVLVVVVVILLVRKLRKNHPKKQKPKKEKKARVKAEKTEASKEAPAERQEDENDPYHE